MSAFDDLIPQNKDHGSFADLVPQSGSNIDLDSPVGSEGVIGGVADFGRGLAHGVISALPTQVGKAAEFFGADGIAKPLKDFGAEQDKAHPELKESIIGQRERENSVLSLRGGAYGAGENLPLSMAPIITAAGGAAIAGPVGAVAGGAAGLAASMPVFYGSQAQDTSEKVEKAQLEAGKTPEEAKAAGRQAGHLSGTIEAGGELAADLIPLGAIAKPFIKPVAGAVVKDVLKGAGKQALKTLAKTEVGEVGTEMAQQAGESAVEGAYGAGPGATVNDTLSVVAPTFLMTLLTGGVAGVHQAHTINSTRKALEDPKADPETRAAAAAAVFDQIKEASPETAQAFDLYATQQIASNKPVQIGDDAFYHDAIKPIAELAGLPAPGQIPLRAGQEGFQPTPEQAQASQEADQNAAAMYAARDAEEARQAGLPPNPDQLALPAPGRTTVISPTGGATPAPVIQQNDQASSDAAQANADAIYGARAAEEARLQQLASHGPLSAAAATSIRTGVAHDSLETRTAAAAPDQASPLEMPDAVTEQEKKATKAVNEFAGRMGTVPLQKAQSIAENATATGNSYTVVPHPRGGFTIVPSTILTESQRQHFAGLQRTGEAPPLPQKTNPTENQVASVLGDNVPRQLPLEQAAAQSKADQKTTSTGQEHEVVPHPTAREKFAVQPVKQPEGVSNGGTKEAAAQRQVEGVSNNQANGARPNESGQAGVRGLPDNQAKAKKPVAHPTLEQDLKDVGERIRGVNGDKEADRFMKVSSQLLKGGKERDALAGQLEGHNELLDNREARDSVKSVGDYYKDEGLRELAHGVRNGDPKAISTASDRMAPLVPEGAVLVPVPGHGGNADQTLKLAQEIAKRSGASVSDVLRGDKRESNFDAKKNGEPLTAKQLAMRVEGIAPQGNAYLIDSVVDSGATLAAARKAIPGAKAIALAQVKTPKPEETTPDDVRYKTTPVIQKAIDRVGHFEFDDVLEKYIDRLESNPETAEKVTPENMQSIVEEWAGDVAEGDYAEHFKGIEGKPGVPEPTGETSLSDLTSKRPEDVFPAPKESARGVENGAPTITPEAAKQKLAEWKAEAKRIGKEEDHSKDVVFSLFDASGVWSKPYEDAGYKVVRYDRSRGDDLMKSLPTADIVALRESGHRIVGVLAAPPCTSFAVSGARWWKTQHDLKSSAMVEKKYGLWATEYFDTPLEYATTLARAVEVFVEFANPEEFHVLENPIGRIQTEVGLPKPTLSFDPANYGDPYTKKTQLWGKFNPKLPTANVEATLGSMVHKLRGDVEEDKVKRSQTPEGFSYAFFMANHALAATAKKSTGRVMSIPEQGAKAFNDNKKRIPPSRLAPAQMKEWFRGWDEAKVAANPPKEVGPKERSAKQLAMDAKLRARANARRRVNPDVDTLMTAVIKLGGIKDSPDARKQLTGETKVNPRIPFVGTLFTKTGLGADVMATDLAQEVYGYLTAKDIEDNVDGGLELLKDRIRDEIAGKPHYSGRRDLDAVMAEKNEAERDAALESKVEEAAESEGEKYAAIVAPEDLLGLEDVSPENPTDIASADLVAQAVLIDESQVENFAQMFADDDAGFMDAIRSFLKDNEDAKNSITAESGTALARPETDEARPAEESFDLAAETNDEVLARESSAKAAAEEKAQAEAKAAAKDEADREVGSFSLSGSDRVADRPGQSDLLSAPAEKPSIEKYREEMAARRDHRDAVVDKLTKLFERDNMVAADRADSTYRMVLTHDAHGAGEYRVTSFDGEEPTGHRVYNSIKDAADEFIPKNMTIVEKPLNDLNHFSLDRVVGDKTETITFKRGEMIKVATGGARMLDAEITGISHAKKTFSVGGMKLEYPFGYAYKDSYDETAKPRSDIQKSVDTLRERLDAGNTIEADQLLEGIVDASSKAKLGHDFIDDIDGLRKSLAALRDKEQKKSEEGKAKEQDAVTEYRDSQPYSLSEHGEIAKRIRAGDITAEELKKQFARLVAAKESIKAELSKKTIKQLAPNGAGGETKARIVDSIFSNMAQRFIVGDSFTWSPTQEKYEDALRRVVAKVTDEQIQKNAAELKERIAGAKKALENPETLEEFRRFASVRGEDALTPEQRAKYDDLRAEVGRDQRERQAERKTEVKAANVTVGAEIVETKHSVKGHDLFVVKLADRVERDAYNTLNTAAKKLGGYYSSFRGRGAVPGFQFKTREAAEAFKALATESDTTAATEISKATKEAKLDARETGAVAKLREMADKMTGDSNASLNADRKTNTAKRAREASGAEENARNALQFAETMRNIADAIESGEAKNLSGIRNKAQLEMLNQLIGGAKNSELNKKYPSYGERERHTGEPATAETAEFSEFPKYTTDQSDLFSAAGKMDSVPGMKMLAGRLRREATNNPDSRGRVTLTTDLVDQLLEKVEAHNESAKNYSDKISLSYWLAEARSRVKRLESMGITDEPSLRAAIREYIQFRGAKREADKAKELERKLVGGKHGIDFFPTPKGVAERMVEEAGIQQGMRVLEPSAGNGNIAEAIRSAGVDPDVAEISGGLREVLEAKKFNVVAQDFMSLSDGEYDRIVMNPPFSANQDAKHVEHAYGLLKPGGRLVAIVGEGVFFRGGKTESHFRAWLDQVGGTVEKLPADTFTDTALLATTGANARLVVIDKPEAPELHRMLDPSENIELAISPSTELVDHTAHPALAGLFGEPLLKYNFSFAAKAKKTTNREAQIISAAMMKLIDIGFPLSNIAKVTNFFTQENGAQATFYPDTRSIGVDRQTLIYAATDGAWAQKLAGVLAHEMAHGADLGKNFYSADHPAFEIGPRDASGLRKPVGGIAKEAFAAFVQRPDLRSYLVYPFRNLHDEPTNGKNDREFAQVIQCEVFAQLSSLYYTNPKLLRATMPKAYDLFKDIHERSTNQSSAAGHRAGSPVFDALRNLGADGLPSGNVAGRGQRDDRARTGDRTAGAGLGQQASVQHAGAVAQEPLFYSPLAKAIAEKAPFSKSGELDARMLQNWLTARTKDGTVKADEVKWSGLEDFLKLEGGKVTREQVRDFLDQNGVRVEETMLAQDNLQQVSSEIDRLTVELTAKGYTPVTDYDDGLQEVKRNSDGVVFTHTDFRWSTDGESEFLPKDVAKMATRLGELLYEQSNDDGPSDATKYHDYQLPGGKNYRELLLKLPVPKSRQFDPSKLEVKRDRRSVTQGTVQLVYDGAEIGQRYDDTGPISTNYMLTEAHWAGVAKRIVESEGGFRAPHFSDHANNLLAHVRFNERTDADGKRVLFIEEFQSDWAQKGRREGFGDAAKKLAVRKERTALNDERLLLNRKRDDEGAHWTKADRDRGDALNNRIAVLDEQLGTMGTIPAAPFVNKTEAWVALALKRMIRYAADHGFERVAWTNGDQQADRYQLSKQISSLRLINGWEKYPTQRGGVVNRNRGVSAEKPLLLVAYDKSNNVVIEKGVNEKELPDLIGKEAARKLLEAPEIDQYERALSGVDLDVGGEGMKSFYDQIVPNVANDVLKKLGGGRVGEVNLGGGSYTIIKMGDEWAVLTSDKNGEYPVAKRDTREEAQIVADRMAKRYDLVGSNQPGFDITPEMLPQSSKAQPLFFQLGDAPPNGPVRTLGSTLADGARDLFQTSKGFNLWHKTVGTQYHKAEVNPRFGKVFNGVQAYLNEASLMMNEAADLAPGLLPKLGGVADIFKRGASRKDIQSVSSAIFDGRIEDRVWTDAELEQRGMDPAQRDLYHQARASIDKSLTDVTLSEAIKQARGVLPGEVLAQARASGDPWSVVTALSDIPSEERTPTQQKVYDNLRERMAHLEDMKRQGYAPLMRFGQYTVTVKDAEGAVQLFTMHESERAANAFARSVRGNLATGETMRQGVMSQDAWKLFQGVSPDTLEIFAQSLGASEKEVFQSYLKDVVNNKSTMKRLIRARKIEGFNDDIQRVLAQFITSNGRAASKNYHWGSILGAANELREAAKSGDAAGDVVDEAVDLVKYIENPKDEAGAVRGLLFIQYLGGSVASALTNATQPILMSFPYLAKYGAANAARELVAAGKIAAGGEASDPRLAAAMQRATEEGVIAPHEVAGLYAETMRNFGSNMAVRRAIKTWGAAFSLAETFNRRITFVAAYRLAEAAGEASPFAAAEKAVADTQGVYNRGNRPNWARGAVGATLFTFKQYSVAYVEFLKRLPPRQRAIALSMLVLAAGLQGLPGADDLEDIIDTIAESLGYSFNSKKQLREFAARTLGEDLGGFLVGGASHLPGVPIDVQARLGVGNLIPGTALLKRSEPDKTRDAVEFFGPAGSQAQSFVKAISAAQDGNFKQIGMSALPVAIQNALKAMDMAQTGYYRDDKGRRVIDVDAADAAIKAIGFQPRKVAKQSTVVQDVHQDVALNKDVAGSIADQWARGIFEKDPDAIDQARAKLLEWNNTNPTNRVFVTPIQIQTRVREMLLTREQRFLKSTPKSLRLSVMDELQSVR